MVGVPPLAGRRVSSEKRRERRGFFSRYSLLQNDEEMGPPTRNIKTRSAQGRPGLGPMAGSLNQSSASALQYIILTYTYTPGFSGSYGIT